MGTDRTGRDGVFANGALCKMYENYCIVLFIKYLIGTTLCKNDLRNRLVTIYVRIYFVLIPTRNLNIFLVHFRIFGAHFNISFIQFRFQ